MIKLFLYYCGDMLGDQEVLVRVDLVLHPHGIALTFLKLDS